MKYNLGCGNDYKFGWVNCDKYPAAMPDLVVDLESFPWPIEDETADEILLSHVLEHLGGHSETFLSVMKELYRICRPGARIVIRVPDPRHNDYFSDPTHQRPIIPETFHPLDLALNETWQSHGLPGTPLGKYLNIDLPTVSVTRHLDPKWLGAWNAKTIGDAALGEAALANNNVVQWSEIVLEARKPFRPGRSLEKADALVAKRVGGLGDVVMALSALSAVKAAVGIPVFLETSEHYRDIAASCTALDGVFTDSRDVMGALQRKGLKTVRYVDWSPAHFGVSRLHQVDAFLMSLGVTLPDSSKGVDLDLAGVDVPAEHLAALAPGRRRIVLHPGITDPNRTWSAAFWHALAEDLVAAGDAVFLIGAGQSQDGRGVAKLDHPAVVDLTDRLSPLQTVALLRRCDVLISGDSGPVQLAGASDIGVVGLYSVVSGRNRLPYRSGSTRHKAVAVEPSCAFHPCYPRMHDPVAAASFCAQEQVAPTDTPRLFSRWCVNPDRYACVREPATAERVLEAVERVLGDADGSRAPPMPAERPPGTAVSGTPLGSTPTIALAAPPR